ncbi:lamin tail domain-containing protein [Candidatus Saccharibacteria bacterium]|nr:lamin tail domain-containing protein [Candidatus Saccharibacteria bacterium]
MLKKLVAFITIAVSFALPLVPVAVHADSAGTSVVISEVVAGTSASAGQEIVELYNNSTNTIDVSGWKIIFVSSSGSQKELTTLSGTMLAGEVLLLASPSYPLAAEVVDGSFADGSLTYNGHIMVQDQSLQIIDIVGWGSALSYEGAPTATLSGGKALERYAGCEAGLIDTGNNSQDFFVDQVPTPGVLALQTKASCAAGGTDCSVVIISEVLPNPAGSDTGNEFIELHNPTTAPVDLYGCSLVLGSDVFAFAPGTILEAGEYKAFYDGTTGLTLPNSAGGTVSLVSDTHEYIMQYPGGLADNIAWVVIDDVWQPTSQATPSETNVIQIVAAGQGADELEACPEGKYRNPETNRCKTIESNELQACDEGQERNPETNRCRKISASGSTLTPCDPGEERNAETNRCRKVAGATSLTACQPGYERNPETNRCRKVTTATGALTNTAVAAQNPVSYPVFGVTTALAMGYGLFEYRHDIKNWFTRLRAK